jgi:hypothetical protein
MKAILGLILACGACCAVPFIAAGLIGAGTAGAILSFWQWEIGAAIAALAAVGGIVIWYQRKRTGATCRVDGPRSKVQSGCWPTATSETARQSD